MNFNMEIIENAIYSNFMKEMYRELYHYSSDLEYDDFKDMFNNDIQSIDMDDINNLKIIEYNIVNIDDEIEINGNMEVSIKLDGYSTYDNELALIESVGINVIVDFVLYYNDKDEIFEEFEILEVYF